MTKKTAKKTATSPRNGAVIPIGAHAGNTGGKKGRSGRPPQAFKDFLARLRSDPTVQAALEAAASDETCSGFRSAWKVITDYDTEKPAEKRELSGKLEVRVAFTREGRRVTAS